MPVGMEVTEDTPPDMLTGSMNLKLVLPSGKKIKTSVERSTPMMDLLVHVTTCHKLAPAAHVLQPYGERGILPYKPSTPIGALDTVMVHVIPKNQLTQNQSNKMALKQVSQPFEQTYRIQVSLPRNQLYVLRANGRTTVSDIHAEICNEKNLDATKYSLRHPKELGTELKGDMTIAEYKSNQLVLVSNRSNPSNQFSTDDIINAIHNINNNNNNNIYAFEPSSRSLSPDSSMSPVTVQEPLKPLRKKKPPAPPPPNSKKTVKKGGVGEEAGAGGPGRVISHSRTSSDSSGYHEASLLSESPPSNNSSLPDSLPRRSKLEAKQKGSRDQLGTHSALPESSVQQNQALSKSMIDLKAHHAESSSSSSNAHHLSSLKSAQSTTSLNIGRKKRVAPLPPPSSVPPMKTVIEERLNGNSDTGSENMDIGTVERSRTLEIERKPVLEPAVKSQTLPAGLTMSSGVESKPECTPVVPVEMQPVTDVVPVAPPVARPRSFVGVDVDMGMDVLESDGLVGSQTLPDDKKRLDGLGRNPSTIDYESRTPLERIEEGVVSVRPQVAKRSRAPPIPSKRSSLICENDVKAVIPVATPRRLSLTTNSNAEVSSDSPNEDPTAINVLPSIKKRESTSSRISTNSDERYYSADSESDETSLKGIDNTETIDTSDEIDTHDEIDLDIHLPIVRAIPVQLEYEPTVEINDSSQIQPSDDNVSRVEVSGKYVEDEVPEIKSSVKIVAAQMKEVEKDRMDSDKIVIEVRGESEDFDCGVENDVIGDKDLNDVVTEVVEVTESKLDDDNVCVEVSRTFEKVSDNSDSFVRSIASKSISSRTMGSSSNSVDDLSKRIDSRFTEIKQSILKSTSLVFDSEPLVDDLTKDSHEFGDVKIKLRRPFSFGEWSSSSDLLSLSNRRKCFQEAFSKFDNTQASLDKARKEFSNRHFPKGRFLSSKNFFEKRRSLVETFDNFELNSPNEEDSGVEITEVSDTYENDSQDKIDSPLITEPIDRFDDKTIIKEEQIVENPHINWSHHPVKNGIESELKSNDDPLDQSSSVSSVRDLLKSFEGLKSTSDEKKSISWKRSINSDDENSLKSSVISSRSSLDSRSPSVEEDVFPQNARPSQDRAKHGSVRDTKPNPLRSRLRQVESTGDLESVAQSISGSRLRTKWPPKPNLSDESDLVMEDDEIDRIFNNATAEHTSSMTRPSPLIEGDSGRDSTDSNEVRKTFSVVSPSVEKIEEFCESPKNLHVLPSPVRTAQDEPLMDWEYKLPAPPTFRDPPESPEVARTKDTSDPASEASVTPRSAVMTELSTVISKRGSSVPKPTEDLATNSVDEIENTSTLNNFKITTYAKNNRSSTNVNPNVSVRRNNSLVRETGVGSEGTNDSQSANTVKRSVSHVSLFVRPFDNSRSRTLDRVQNSQTNSVGLRKTTSELNIDSVGRGQIRPQSYAEPQSLQSLQVLKSILPQLSRSQGSLNTIIEAEPAVKPPPSVDTEKPPTRYEREDKVAVSLSTWGERPKRQVSIKSDRDYVFGSGGGAFGRRTSSSENPEVQEVGSSGHPQIKCVPFGVGVSQVKGSVSSTDLNSQEVSKTASDDKSDSGTVLDECYQSDDDKKAKRVSNVYKNLDTGNTKPLRHILGDVSRIPVVKSVELKQPYKKDWQRNTGLDKLKERFEADVVKEQDSSPKELESFESTDKIRLRFESAIKERYETTEKMFNRCDHLDTSTYKPRETTKININRQSAQWNDSRYPFHENKYESKVKIDGSQTLVSSVNKTETKIELNKIDPTTPPTNRYTSVIGIGGSDCEVRVRVKTSTGRSSMVPSQNLPPADPRQQLLTSIRGFGGLEALKKVRS